MSKLLMLDITTISQRYSTETAWFDCKRSSHYSVFLLWKKSVYEQPELRLFYKGRSGQKVRLQWDDMLRQYHKVGEAMSLSQAEELWKELKIEAMASLARYQYALDNRKTKISHAQGDNPWQAASNALKQEFDFVWPRWLTEITKGAVPCYRRGPAELGPRGGLTRPYLLDDNGRRIRLYSALHDTVREDVVNICLPVCKRCIECAACDTPCHKMPLDLVVPLIRDKISDIENEGTANIQEEEWYTSVRSCRMFRPIRCEMTVESRLHVS